MKTLHTPEPLNVVADKNGQSLNVKLGVKGFIKSPAIQRLMSRVVVLEDCGCWVYTGSKVKGYGQIWVDGRHRLAHRVSYEHHIGTIANDRELDHLCRNKACVNPAHLEPVTHKENMLRADAGHHEKIKTHCIRGHEFTEENTRRSRGKRVCRECVRLSGEKRRIAARAAIAAVKKGGAA